MHSSMDYVCASQRWSRTARDMEPEKSWIGEISVRISSSPDRMAASACRLRHSAPPTSQSKDWVCRARRFGTSSGSRSFAKETRLLPEVGLDKLVTAKMRPFRTNALLDYHCAGPTLRGRLLRGERCVDEHGVGTRCDAGLLVPGELAFCVIAGDDGGHCSDLTAGRPPGISAGQHRSARMNGGPP